MFTADETDEAKASFLIFSVSGRIGSGATQVAKLVAYHLAGFGYQTEIIPVSSILKAYVAGVSDVAEEEEDGYLQRVEAELSTRFENREAQVRALQDAGDALRKEYGNSVLSELVVQDYILKELKQPADLNRRIAFVVDSLKRPEEVQFLRKVFGDSYYALGVVCTDSLRIERLVQKKKFEPATAEDVSTRDQKDGDNKINGQRTVDTVLESDYFFANEDKERTKAEVGRFLELLFGASIVTPRVDEFVMNVAFKAAARSACLSRQVGAAIADEDGEVIATGWNEVPRYGGGLYSAESKKDERCFARGGMCYNDDEKNKIDKDLIKLFRESKRLEKLLDNLKITERAEREELVSDLVDVLANSLKSSRIRQLIEFSRAVHAEMEAILSIARSGKKGLVGGTLYCTTYPCHNCAKHLINAGITRLVYLEPYEKSLARQLHADAINDRGSGKGEQVVLSLYNGVAPKRYSDFFDAVIDRKSQGTGEYIDRSLYQQKLNVRYSIESAILWQKIESIKGNVSTSSIQLHQLKGSQSNVDDKPRSSSSIDSAQL